MRADREEIRLDVLVVNGSLMLILGLALLYLQGIMTNLLFDIIAVVSAVVLSAAAFIMIAIVDFCAAASLGIKRLHDVVFYSIVGIAFATSGALEALSSQGVLQVLLVLAIIHGLAFGALGYAAAQNPSFSRFERIALYSFATVSIAFSGTIAGLARNLDNRSSVGWIGAYLCFAGVKLFFLGGVFGYQRTHPAPADELSGGKSSSTFGPLGAPAEKGLLKT
jgi:hypothetical protein